MPRAAAQPEPLPTRADLTRERILAAAEAEFARHGLNGTRVRAIADAAGVNVATLYLYFPSKNDLHEAVLERGVRPLMEMMATFAASPRGIEAGERFLTAVLRHLGERPHLSRLIYLEAIAEGRHLTRLARRWLRPLLEAALGQLKDASVARQWEERLHPLIIAAFVHLTFGHFALAPLFEEVFGSDPTAPDWVERETAFVVTLAKRMFPEPDPRPRRAAAPRRT